jgi:hypothetical protein
MILGQKYNAFQYCQLLVLISDDGKIGIITNYAINHFNQNPY